MGMNEEPKPAQIEGTMDGVLPVLTRQLTIAPSMADATGHLALHAAFSLFSDSANAHADAMEVGYFELIEKDLFWLAVKSKVCFAKRPRLGETVTLQTWPGEPGRIRCERYYQMTQGDEVLVSGKTEWAIINWETQNLVPPRDIYPESLTFPLGSCCPEPFARIPDKFEDIQPYASYQVRSTDIDVGEHMNNAAYVRALVGTFSNQELAEMDIHTMDVNFRTSCFEGDVLEFQRKEVETGDNLGLDIRISKGGETIALAHIE